MKVRELLEALKDADPDYEVSIESDNDVSYECNADEIETLYTSELVRIWIKRRG